jgi:hypothetical protein
MSIVFGYMLVPTIEIQQLVFINKKLANLGHLFFKFHLNWFESNFQDIIFLFFVSEILFFIK